MRICSSRKADQARLSIQHTIVSRIGGRRYTLSRVELLHKRQIILPPQPVTQRQTVHNTIYQTVVHLHQTTLQHIHRQIHAANYLRQDAFLFVLPQVVSQQVRQNTLDPSRPTRAARTLLHIFSRESAKRELRPFYSDVVRSVLREEQERYKSRPTKAISLIWNLFGQPNAFRTLTRFYLGAVEKLGTNYFPALNGPNALYLAAGVVMHSRVYKRYIHQFWTQESPQLPLRYTAREAPVLDDLMHLPVARRTILPSRETLERLVRSVDKGDSQAPLSSGGSPTPDQEMRLSEADFRALVRGVTTSLSRQARLESLQRGGIS